MDLREWKYREDEVNYKMQSFVICTLRLKSLRWWNQGEWNGRNM